MKNPEIVFTDINKAKLLDSKDREPSENEVRVKTVISTISPGTERANITGNPNIGISSSENEKAVFPRYQGYSSSGIVTDVGAKVTSVKPGDRVAMFWSLHRLYNILPENNVVKIEDDNISFEEAAICHIGNFPMAAIRKTRLEIGESALVMGLGTLGLLATAYFRAAVGPARHRRRPFGKPKKQGYEVRCRLCP